MSRVFAFIWEAVCWVQIFLSPTGIGGVVAGMLYGYAHVPAWVSWSVLGIGAVAGVYVAERVRRRIGCTIFMGRIYGSPGNPE